MTQRDAEGCDVARSPCDHQKNSLDTVTFGARAQLPAEDRYRARFVARCEAMSEGGHCERTHR